MEMQALKSPIEGPFSAYFATFNATADVNKVVGYYCKVICKQNIPQKVHFSAQILPKFSEVSCLEFIGKSVN